MQGSYSDAEALLPMRPERRKRKRFKMDYPVTVLTPGRGKKRTIGNGLLEDISDNGARFHLDHPLVAGNRVSLEVHFLDPDGEVIDIRFRGIVLRVTLSFSYEIAVSFLKGTSFPRRQHSRGKDQPISKGCNWIN